jgi:anaphase-promoting complex subunit 2
VLFFGGAACVETMASVGSTTLQDTNIYERLLARANERAKLAHDRPTSAFVREVFGSDRGYSDKGRLEVVDNSEEWRTLPSKLLKLATYLRDHPSFHSSLQERNAVNSNSGAVERIETSFDDVRRQLAAAVFARTISSYTFLDNFRRLFEALLNARQKKWRMERSEMMLDDSMDVEDDKDDDDHDYELLLQQEDQLFQSLAILGWVPIQLRRPFREALHSVTMKFIEQLAAGKFSEEGVLDRVLQWKNDTILPWTYRVLGPETFVKEKWEAQLEYIASECFIHIRMKELFDLTTDYPDSLPAIRELSLALESTGRLWYRQLSLEWRNALVSRLLHPGAETSQIIEVYISTIKVLREMDPSGELLQFVTQPVREYLHSRTDTIRCIITSLTDEENGGELYEELRRHDAKPLEEAQLDEDDEEEPPTFDWEPLPSILKGRGVLSGQVGRVPSISRRSGDILAMLVGIYGSKELFVNEYRIMLADKLLGNVEFDTDKDVHNLELLKLRFGEQSLQQCEVMIKDIDDSKRIQSNIHSTLRASHQRGDDGAPPVVVDAAIVSHIFWPALQREEMKYHPSVKSQLDEFSVEYAKLKNPRRLIWMKQLGLVEIEVEAYEKDTDGNIVSHTKEVSCTPAHANLLAHFEDQSEWTSKSLCVETKMSEDMVRKRMGFWVNQRVIQSRRLREGDDILYCVVSVSEAADAHDTSFQQDDDAQEHAVSIGAHAEEEMKVYESYIIGMLKNLGQLPVDRIHSMLKTFVAGSDHMYDKTTQQLAGFLKQLCKEEKLECSPDGLYQLVSHNERQTRRR